MAPDLRKKATKAAAEQRDDAGEGRVRADDKQPSPLPLSLTPPASGRSDGFVNDGGSGAEGVAELP